jgi:hypothetical protein
MSDDEADFIHEFEWTRPRHGGLIINAAPIFDMRPEALARRLQRAKANGYNGFFTSEGMKK